MAYDDDYHHAGSPGRQAERLRYPASADMTTLFPLTSSLQTYLQWDLRNPKTSVGRWICRPWRLHYFVYPGRGSQRVLPRNVPAGQGASSEPPSSGSRSSPFFQPLSGQSCSQKLRRAPVWMGCQALLVARRQVGRPTGGSTDPRQSGRLTKSRHARCIWAFQKEKKARVFGG